MQGFLADVASEDEDLRAVMIANGDLRPDEDQDAGADELPEGLETYWIAWNALTTDRPYGAMGGAGGIYYSAISSYARDHDIAGDELHVLVTLVRAMDAEYLLWVSETQPQKETDNDGDAQVFEGDV